MWRNLMRLVGKDLSLYRNNILFAHGSLLAVLMALDWMSPTREISPTIGLTLSVTAFIQLNTAYGDWFILRERSQGTFGFMRRFPVSDSQIVGAKFLLVGFLMGVGFTVQTAVFAPRYLALEWVRPFALILIGLWAFGSLTIASRLCLGSRWGGAVPYLILFVPVGAFIVLERYSVWAMAIMAELWLSGVLPIALGVGGCLCIAGLWWLTVGYFQSRDSAQLGEI